MSFCHASGMHQSTMIPSSICFRKIEAPIRRLAVVPCRPGVSINSNRSQSLRLQAQKNFGTQIIGGGLGGSNEIFVAGADGQLGVRVVQKLLQAGFKVAAGVSDEEQAQSIVDFATSVELLKKDEVKKLRLEEIDLADPESLQAALPRRARIVVVVSDSSAKGSAKVDGKATSRILEAAQENDAQQFVLVTPAGTSGGGGFFSNFFGGSPSVGGSGRKPSKVEQEIASSGLDFVVIRTGKTDVDGEFESSNFVALGPQGSLPSKSNISKGQVADVVQQILRQADSDVLIEAWAGPDGTESNIEDLVAEALPAATIEEEEEEEEETPEPVQAVQEVAEEAEVPEEIEKPARKLFGGFGTKKIKSGPSSEESEEPDVPEEIEKPARKLFGGFGTRKIKTPSSDDSEESTPPPAAKKRPTPPAARRPSKSDVTENGAETGTQRVGLFGFGKKAKQQEEEEEEAPAKPQRGLFGLGGKKQVQEEEEEAPAKPQRGLFGLGGKKQQEEEEEEEPAPSPLKNLFGSKKKEQADITPQNARSSAARGVKAVGRAAKKAAPAPARKQRGGQKEEEKPQKKGFLSSIGLSTDKYEYDDQGDKY